MFNKTNIYKMFNHILQISKIIYYNKQDVLEYNFRN